MPITKLERNRMYIDLIHGKKFNSAQRKSIKNAIEADLNMAQLKQLAKEIYSSEHIDEFVKLMKNATYKDNKQLYAIFMNEKIEDKILNQINLALEDEMDEQTILEFARPDLYSADQMNELRLFLRKGVYTKDYYHFIFDKNKSSDAMRSIREICALEVPFDEIESFDCYSELYPTMLEAVINGILPQEVHMILEVTNDKKKFETIVNGIKLGLDDEEIQMCLHADDRHLDFVLNLMGEVHDFTFMEKFIKIKEIPRRNLLESFKDENTFFKFLLFVHKANQGNQKEQIETFFSDCGKFEETKILIEDNYLKDFVNKVIHDERMVNKLALKALLLGEISTAYDIQDFYPDKVFVSQILEDVCMFQYEELIEYKNQMNYFLSHYNVVMDLLQEKADTIKQGDGFITFELCKGFEIMLKEYKDYYDIEKVTIKYNENKLCEILHNQLEEMASNVRKVRINEHARLPQRLKSGDKIL